VAFLHGHHHVGHGREHHDLAGNVTTGYEVWTDAQLSKRAHDLAYELRLVDEEMVRRAEKLEKRE